MTDRQIKTQTQAWIENVIVGLNICPFAHKVHQQDGIRYSVCKESSLERCLEALILECLRLDTAPDIATTLLIYPNTFKAFDDYLDFLSLAESLLVEQGYEGVYQLASFHPDYCFEGCDESDPANYTNRSPYPMLHLIREDSLEKALASHPDPEGIPHRNIKLTRRLGKTKMEDLLAASYRTDTE